MSLGYYLLVKTFIILYPKTCKTHLLYSLCTNYAWNKVYVKYFISNYRYRK